MHTAILAGSQAQGRVLLPGLSSNWFQMSLHCNQVASLMLRFETSWPSGPQSAEPVQVFVYDPCLKL